MSDTSEFDGVADQPARANGRRRWAAYSQSRVGAAHLRHGIVCQDHSAAKVIDHTGQWTDDGQGTWAYAVVADGHGGVRHFRSEAGARFAVEAMRSAFIRIPNELVAGSVTTDGPVAADPLLLDVWRTASARLIVSEWRTLVYEDLLRWPPGDPEKELGLGRMLDEVRERQGEREKQHLREQIAAFRQHAEEMGGPHGLYDPDQGSVPPLPLPSDPRWAPDMLGEWHAPAYGTTLLGVLVGPEALYWLRIGDGAMIQIVGGEAVELSSSPPEAIANQTPSLSDDRAVDKIEVGAVPLVEGTIPSAVVVATDGVPNSYTDHSGFLEFCEEVARRAAADKAAVAVPMPHWLTELSARGSGDDMSVAMTWVTGSTGKAEGAIDAEAG